MSNTKDSPEATSSRIMYRVQKITEGLETMAIEEHGTVVNILQTMFNLRAMEFQKKRNEDEEAVKAAADRESKFGLNPPPRPAN
jgi:hypothetical protein